MSKYCYLLVGEPPGVLLFPFQKDHLICSVLYSVGKPCSKGMCTRAGQSIRKIFCLHGKNVFLLRFVAWISPISIGQIRAMTVLLILTGTFFENHAVAAVLTHRIFIQLNGCGLQMVIGAELDVVSTWKPCQIRASNLSCAHRVFWPCI